MTLKEAVSTCLSKYATFSGRASREEYWKFLLAYWLTLILLAVMYNVTKWGIFGYAAAIVLFGSVVPILSVGVRRLHDTGRPWTTLFLRLIPFAGDLILFIYSVEDSQPFTNIYGPSPKSGPFAPVPGAGPGLQTQVPARPGQVADIASATRAFFTMNPVTPPQIIGQALRDRQGAQPSSSEINTPAPAEEDLDPPFNKAPHQASFQALVGNGYESGEPAVDPKKVDDFFGQARGLKPVLSTTPRSGFSFSKMSRKSLGLMGAGVAVALVLLGIALGAGSWRDTPQPTVQAAAPAVQPAVAPSPTAIFSQQAALQPPVATAAAAPTIPPTSPAAIIQPGDLGLTSPLRPVDCTGKFIVVYHSSIVPAAYAQDIQANLASHPGSKYLITLGSCSSLNAMSNSGTMIYAVYGGPFDSLAQACVAASRFADEAYVKVLDNITPPDQAVRSCQ